MPLPAAVKQVCFAMGTLAALAAFGIGQRASANLIVNGDFESCSTTLAPNGGTLSQCGWTFANSAGPEAGGNPGLGVRLESTGNGTFDPTAQQSVGGLTVGANYILSWDREVRFNFGSTASNGPSFGVFLDNQTLADALFLLPTGTLNFTYQPEQVVFTATATTHIFIFAGELDARSNGAGRTDVSHRLDNVSLLATTVLPEPGALAMLGLGLIGLGVTRRKRIS